jgi:hypothetical protein
VHLPAADAPRRKVARGIQRTDVEVLEAVGSARAFVADPLRSLAADVRAGVASPDQPGKGDPYQDVQIRRPPRHLPHGRLGPDVLERVDERALHG